jgi:hypothetical protein
MRRAHRNDGPNASVRVAVRRQGMRLQFSTVNCLTQAPSVHAIGLIIEEASEPSDMTSKVKGKENRIQRRGIER